MLFRAGLFKPKAIRLDALGHDGARAKRICATLARMNGLDWALIIVLVFAAFRGFFRGFVVELASLLAVILGIWIAVHYNARVAAVVGLDADQEVISFIITFFAVLVIVHIMAKLITKGLDMAMLGLPNKVAGTLFGAIRSAFMLSVILNILAFSSGGVGIIPKGIVDGSVLYRPLRAFAPMLVPALAETGWMEDAVEAVKGYTNAD